MDKKNVTFRNKIYMNDVFNKYGEAGGQYTYPSQIDFIKKDSNLDNIIPPNYHFDLCRLAMTILDELNTDIAAAVEGADMVVVCTPMRAMVDIFQCIKPVLSAGAVLTDAGSVKQTVVVAAEQAFGEVPSFLVPAHPIAGTEHSGVDASFASLYEGRRVIVTPTEFTDPHAVDRVEVRV